MILPCTCSHATQDALHGYGLRVYNPSGKPGNPMKCSVCGAKRFHFEKKK